jgi:hypothetical protein
MALSRRPSGLRNHGVGNDGDRAGDVLPMLQQFGSDLGRWVTSREPIKIQGSPKVKDALLIRCSLANPGTLRRPAPASSSDKQKKLYERRRGGNIGCPPDAEHLMRALWPVGDQCHLGLADTRGAGSTAP